jgi:hypothetical protein
MKNCTAVVVNYKTLNLTAICLDLLKLYAPDLRVIVVDNGSNDASLTYLRGKTWITLLERDSSGEAPHIAHARALDLAVNKVKTPYMLCLHSDTFLYRGSLVTKMLDMASRSNAVAVGTLEQVHRSPMRQWIRETRRRIRNFARRSVSKLSASTRRNSEAKETYLKSFCCLWNVEVIREHGLWFEGSGRNPGYEMQDFLKSSGCHLMELPAKFIFQHLDHVQSGTFAELGKHGETHRRRAEYQRVVPIALARSHSSSENFAGNVDSQPRISAVPDKQFS